MTKKLKFTPTVGEMGDDLMFYCNECAQAIRHLHLLTKAHWECPDP